MKKQIYFLILTLSLTACGAHQTSFSPSSFSKQNSLYTSSQSRIIGTNDLIKVNKDGSNIDSKFRSYLNAFGIITIGQGVCSGTHLGNGYVLTAGHCMLPEGQQGSLRRKECSNIKVYWGYRGSIETGSPKPVINKVSQCTEIVYAQVINGSDFAIFKVDQAPDTFISILKSGERAPKNSKLTIFGYPKGRPLEWSQYCSLTPNPSTPSEFLHQCDTEPGNSGSSILATTRSGTPMVVGIHNSGTDQFNLATHLADAINTMRQNGGFDLVSAVK